jgi:hypothetical protein
LPRGHARPEARDSSFTRTRGRVAHDPEVAAELEQATVAARRAVVRRLALTPKKEVFVDIHGVGNQFDDAIVSAAEFWHFLGREGVPIAYTRPAGAKGLFFYTVDRESGEFTILHLKQFLRILSDIPEVEKIHIAAHSRGADVATTALRELVIESRAAGEDPRERYKIENVVLIAADLDLEVAMQRLIGEALGPAVGRTTIYTNAKDSALATAKSLFHSRQRVDAMTPTALTPRQREVMQLVANLDVIVYEGSGGRSVAVLGMRKGHPCPFRPLRSATTFCAPAVLRSQRGSTRRSPTAPTNDLSACRMRLHTASAGSGTSRTIRSTSAPSPLRPYARAYAYRGLRALASLSMARSAGSSGTVTSETR